jgi:hypothetical protein
MNGDFSALLINERLLRTKAPPHLNALRFTAQFFRATTCPLSGSSHDANRVFSTCTPPPRKPNEIQSI